MLATQSSGRLATIPNIVIEIPILRGYQAFNGGNINNALLKNGKYIITLNNLPEISDTKNSDYPDENITGRSFPIKVYSHSGNRQINMKLHLYVLEDNDPSKNLQHLRALQSAVYPDETATLPYVPPPICRIKVGKLLTSHNDGFLCVILKSYSTNYPVDVVWDEQLYLPYKLDIDLNWEVVFTNSNLPGQRRIFTDV